jgi:hypothetical protein
MIELHECEIEALIRQGLLPPEDRDDPEAVSEGALCVLRSNIGARRVTAVGSSIEHWRVTRNGSGFFDRTLARDA